MQPKTSSTTLFLNFLIPGVGHLYASDGKSWGLLAANIACAVTGTFLIFPWIGNLICWGVGMAQSNELTARYNRQAMELEEEAHYETETRAKQAAAEEKQAAERQAAETEAKARAAQIDAEEVKGEELSQQYAKWHALLQSGVMSEDEVASEQKKVVAATLNGWTDQGLSDFLGPFAQLLSTGGIDKASLGTVKIIYSALRKGRPSV